MSWGWIERPRRHAPVLKGDVDDIVRTGRFTRAELEHASRMLTAGFPDIPVVVRWKLETNAVSVEAEAGNCTMEQTFQGLRDNLHVDYVSFLLAEDLRDSGLGTEMVRASLTVYDQLGVKSVQIKTFMDGNLKWALLRAYPLDPEGDGLALIAHIKKLRAEKKGKSDERLTRKEAAVLWHTIEDSLRDEPEHLMYNVACLMNGNRAIGENVLATFPWEGTWRLDREVQRSLIARALSVNHPS